MKILKVEKETVLTNSGTTVYVEIPHGTRRISWFAVCTGAVPVDFRGFLRYVAKTTNQSYDYLETTPRFTIALADTPDSGGSEVFAATHFAVSMSAGVTTIKFLYALYFEIVE